MLMKTAKADALARAVGRLGHARTATTAHLGIDQI